MVPEFLVGWDWHAALARWRNGDYSLGWIVQQTATPISRHGACSCRLGSASRQSEAHAPSFEEAVFLALVKHGGRAKEIAETAYRPRSGAAAPAAGGRADRPAERTPEAKPCPECGGTEVKKGTAYPESVGDDYEPCPACLPANKEAP